MSNNLHGEQKKSYFKSVWSYYFESHPKSVFTVLYLLFFGYFAVFYFKNLILAMRFVLNTFFSSTFSLGVDYLIWGAIFTISLLVPFFASLFAIIFPFELKKKTWPRTTRTLITLAVSFLLINFILISDFSLGYVERQSPIRTFLELRDIPQRP